MNVSVHGSSCGHILGNAWSYHVSAEACSSLGNVLYLSRAAHTPQWAPVCMGRSPSFIFFSSHLLFSFLEQNMQATVCMCNRDNHSKYRALLGARTDRNGWVLCEIADWLIIHDPSRLFTQREANADSFVLFWVLLANLFDLAACK